MSKLQFLEFPLITASSIEIKSRLAASIRKKQVEGNYYWARKCSKQMEGDAYVGSF